MSPLPRLLSNIPGRRINVPCALCSLQFWQPSAMISKRIPSHIIVRTVQRSFPISYLLTRMRRTIRRRDGVRGTTPILFESSGFSLPLLERLIRNHRFLSPSQDTSGSFHQTTIRPDAGGFTHPFSFLSNQKASCL